MLKALSEHFDLILVSEAGEDKQGIVGLVHIQNELDASRVIKLICCGMYMVAQHIDSVCALKTNTAFRFATYSCTFVAQSW